ncbi:MAG: Gfo/Idh/MocA family oxidoreductase [Bacteroidota bacterium]
MLKIGVIGAGHLGKIHIKCILQIANFKLVGFYDIDPIVKESVSKEFNIHSYSTIEEMFENVDVVDIITPTIAHFQYAAMAIRKLKHVFIEKPIVTTPEEARQLVELSHEANVKVQVGHVERLNPAFVAVKNAINNPMFIEAHRLAIYNPRGTDVPVVLDLMIHDIDVILSIVKSPIKKIHASGVAIVSQTPDIANARIEFENGAVANLTASRISLTNMRKIRIFQQDAYISVDFLEKKSDIVKICDTDQEAQPEGSKDIIIKTAENRLKKITFDQPEIIQTNAIKEELELFYTSIINDSTPLVSINDGSNALDVAYQIIKKIS